MSMITTARQYLGTRGQTPAHKYLVDYYNKNCVQYVAPQRKYFMTYYDDWCAMFCSVMAHMNKVPNFPYEVSVYYMWQLAKSKGQATQIPHVNDLIIYDWNNNGSLDHVGIITNVAGNTLTVIEGNGGNEVIYRTINRFDNVIEGFIHLEIPQEVRNETQPNLHTKGIESLIIRTLNGEFGNGDERRRKLGSNYPIVQNAINKLSPIDFMAYDVINGKYGTGEERKRKLGKNYTRVQTRVNQILS